MKLEADKVKKAGDKEITYIKEKEVWIKIPRAQAKAMGIKIIGTKWIDINKGDDEDLTTGADSSPKSSTKPKWTDFSR